MFGDVLTFEEELGHKRNNWNDLNPDTSPYEKYIIIRSLGKINGVPHVEKILLNFNGQAKLSEFIRYYPPMNLESLDLRLRFFSEMFKRPFEYQTVDSVATLYDESHKWEKKMHEK